MIVFEQNPAKGTHNHVGTFESVFAASALVHTAKRRQVAQWTNQKPEENHRTATKKGKALGGAKEMN